jgi:hypothetical protein
MPEKDPAITPEQKPQIYRKESWTAVSAGLDLGIFSGV